MTIERSPTVESDGQPRHHDQYHYHHHPALPFVPLPRLLPTLGGRDPIIRIMVASDLDLPSCARLAEFALQDGDRVGDDEATGFIGGGTVDLCLAVGPFNHPDGDGCGDCDCDDGRGTDRRRSADRGSGVVLGSTGIDRRRAGAFPFHPPRVTRVPFPAPSALAPAPSRESLAAMEGIVTASLSQLETIACRVVYAPGGTDPSSFGGPAARLPTVGPACSNELAFFKELEASMEAGGENGGSSGEAKRRAQWRKRLTSNSRSVDGGWLDLVPGLGCVGWPVQDEWAEGGGGKEKPADGDGGESEGSSSHSDAVRLPAPEGGGRPSSTREQALRTGERLLNMASPATTEAADALPPSSAAAAATLPFARSRAQAILLASSPVASDSCLEFLRQCDGGGGKDDGGGVRQGRVALCSCLEFLRQCDGGCGKDDGEGVRQGRVALCLVGAAAPRAGVKNDDAVANAPEVTPKPQVRDGDDGIGQFQTHAGGAAVVCPGSLRRRGEFAVVEMVLAPAKTAADGPPGVETRREDEDQGDLRSEKAQSPRWKDWKYEWRVRNVSFRKIPWS